MQCHEIFTLFIFSQIIPSKPTRRFFHGTDVFGMLWETREMRQGDQEDTKL